MFAYTLLLIAIMSGTGTPSPDPFVIPNYGPPLPGWPSANSQFSSQFYMPPIPPMPPMPPMPQIEIPNIQQILSQKGKPGAKFQSFIYSDNNGQSTVLTNTDGEVKAFKIDKSRNNGQDNVQVRNIPGGQIMTSFQSGPDSFSGFSTSSFSSSSDNNGKKTQIGGSTVSTNNNGDVKHQTTLFDSRDDD